MSNIFIEEFREGATHLINPNLANRQDVVIADRANVITGVSGINLILEENHSLNMNISTKAIEDGSAITDHAYLLQEQPRMRVLVNAYDDKGNYSADRGKIAYQQLKNLMLNKELVDVYSNLFFYESLLIASVDVNLNKDTGLALYLNISFYKVKLVSPEYMEYRSEVKRTSVQPLPTTQNFLDRNGAPTIPLQNGG